MSDGSDGPAGVVRAYLEAINSHDPDAIAALVTEQFYNEHTSARSTSVRGRAAYRQRLEGFLDSMGDLNYAVNDLAVDGDTVVVAYRMTANYDTGSGRKPFSLRGVFWFEVRDGLVAHRVDYRDGIDFEQQVGLR